MQKRDFCVRTEKISVRTWNLGLHSKISEKTRFICLRYEKWMQKRDFWVQIEKKMQESHVSVYIVKLVQKRKLFVYINRDECKMRIKCLDY